MSHITDALRGMEQCQSPDEAHAYARLLAEKITSPETTRALLFHSFTSARAARDLKVALDELKNELTEGPNREVPVIEVLDEADPLGGVLVGSSRDGIVRVGLLPEEVLPVPRENIFPGAAVHLAPAGSVIVSAPGRLYQFNEAAEVVGVSTEDNKRAQVDFGGGQGKRWVRVLGPLANGNGALEPGMWVLGSAAAGLITELVPEVSAPEQKSEAAQMTIHFAGHRDLKAWLMKWIVQPLTDPQGYLDATTSRQGIGLGGFPLALLATGVTGGGKTYGFRYAAQEAGAVLVELQPSDIRNCYFGNSEGALNAHLVRAAEWVRSGQATCVVVVINEAEALLGSRAGTGDTSVKSTLIAIVDTYLNTIDDLRKRYRDVPIAVGLTSNLPSMIDAAVTQSHRLSAPIIRVGYLAPDEIHEVAEVALTHDVRCADAGGLAQRLGDLLGADATPALSVRVDGKLEDVELNAVITPALVGGILRDAALRSQYEVDGYSPDALVTWPHIAQAAQEVIPGFLRRIADGGLGEMELSLPQYQDRRVTSIDLTYDSQAITVF